MASTAVTHLLEPLLRCASRRCGVVVHSFDADVFSGVYSCKNCGSRNFAFRFHDGSTTHAQLANAFGDDGFIETVMIRYRLPILFKRPNWLSIWIPDLDFKLYRGDPDSSRSRTLLLRLQGT